MYTKWATDPNAAAPKRKMPTEKMQHAIEAARIAVEADAAILGRQSSGADT